MPLETITAPLPEDTRLRLQILVCAINSCVDAGAPLNFCIDTQSPITRDQNSFVAAEILLDDEMINQDIEHGVSLGILKEEQGSLVSSFPDFRCAYNLPMRKYAFYEMDGDIILVRVGENGGQDIHPILDHKSHELGISFALSESMEKRFPKLVENIKNGSMPVVGMVTWDSLMEMSYDGFFTKLEEMHTRAINAPSCADIVKLIQDKLSSPEPKRPS